MKLKLKIIKIEEKKNLVHFEYNGAKYTYNTKTSFIFDEKVKYIPNFDPTVKTLIKNQIISYNKYNKKIQE